LTLITIKTFDNFGEAHILRIKLESEGIACYLFDENMMTLNPLYNITIGGIKLKIKDSDRALAQQIILEIEAIPFTNNTDEVLKCPNCQSTDLYSGFISMKGFKAVLTSIISFLLFIYPFYIKRVYKCKKCNTEFKN